ncbi:hypothetical protein ACVMIH_001651 [Bradyrhizobium sp. USDA 4503]
MTERYANEGRFTVEPLLTAGSGLRVSDAVTTLPQAGSSGDLGVPKSVPELVP